MKQWTFKTLEQGEGTAAYTPEDGARPLHATRDRTNEGCGGFGYFLGCVGFFLSIVFVVGWFVWTTPPTRIAADVPAIVTTPPTTEVTTSGCNCPVGQGWCSFAHCAPCCHSGCTTSANEQAQCDAGTLR